MWTYLCDAGGGRRGESISTYHGDIGLDVAQHFLWPRKIRTVLGNSGWKPLQTRRQNRFRWPWGRNILIRCFPPGSKRTPLLSLPHSCLLCPQTKIASPGRGLRWEPVPIQLLRFMPDESVERCQNSHLLHKVGQKASSKIASVSPMINQVVSFQGSDWDFFLAVSHVSWDSSVIKLGSGKNECQVYGVDGYN